MQPKLLCNFEDGRVTSKDASYGNRDDNEDNRKRGVRFSIRLTDGFSLSVKGSKTQLMLHIEISARIKKRPSHTHRSIRQMEPPLAGGLVARPTRGVDSFGSICRFERGTWVFALLLLERFVALREVPRSLHYYYWS